MRNTSFRNRAAIPVPECGQTSLAVPHARSQKTVVHNEATAEESYGRRRPTGGVTALVRDQLIDQAIKRAVDEQLAQKGLIKVEKNADLYVG